MTGKLVLCRHGQSDWNRKNLFTGWTDIDLTEQGVQESFIAGESLRGLDYDIDVVFTSYLKRAIRTSWCLLVALDRVWIPVIRDWRLNERHYGALQGLNKADAAAKYGLEQVRLWRRGYSVLPPAIEPDDERHPCHDKRYDGIANLPGTESLAKTLDRVRRCWHELITVELSAGKNVLVSAHGNSLRALVMMLDEVSEEDISKLNLPTGIPLVYELDAGLKPISSEYLGDPDVVATAAAAVEGQAESG